MSTVEAWTPNDQIAEAFPITSAASWAELLQRYCDGRPSPQLERIFEIARQHQTKAVLIEQRYIDADWRSEHAGFYGTTFARYPSVSHRLHFFSSCLPEDLGDLSSLGKDCYKGYCVIRPINWAPVGRTMIAPPVELKNAIQCFATEEVNVLGWRFSITSAPFMSQDGEFTRCAHAVMWMVCQHAHLEQGLPRRVPRDIHEASLGGLIVNRQLPSDGLSPHQLLSALTSLGLSPGVVALPQSRESEIDATPIASLFATICRYINCNLPPIVISTTHAWLCVAYMRLADRGGGMVLYRHDDSLGPFIRVDDPYEEANAAHRPWRSAILPLPPKIYITAERAEAVGRWWFLKQIEEGRADAHFLKKYTEDRIAYRTYVQSSNAFKENLPSRENLLSQLAREYRLTNMPRLIWVVEAVDRDRRDIERSAIFGEVVIDPTSRREPTVHDPGILCIFANGRFESTGLDHGEQRSVEISLAVYESGRLVEGQPVRQATASPTSLGSE